MKSQPTKRRWTRAEKCLFATPLLIAAFALFLPYAREIARRKMGLPMRVIPVAGKELLRLFALSPEGELVVGQGENLTLQFYDARSGKPTKELQMLPPAPGQRLDNAVPYGLDFSSKSHQVALGFADKPIEIWDTNTSSFLTRLPRKGMMVTFSPDSHYLATGHGQFWDLQSNRLKFRFPSESDQLPAFSPDGTLMALPNQPIDDEKTRDFSGGSVSLWSVPGGLLKATFPAPAPSRTANNVTFSPDGKRIAFLMQHHVKGSFGQVEGGDLRVFDVQSRRQLWQQTNRGNRSWNDLAYSPDGRVIAVSTWRDCVELHSAQTGKLVTILHSQWPDADLKTIMLGPAVRFTGDGKLLVLRGHHEIYVWNMDEVNAQFAP